MGQKRLSDIAAVLQATVGWPSYLGTITSTGTSVNNHSTSSAFNNTGDALKGRMLQCQADAACYMLPGTTNAAAVTSANGVLIPANGTYVVTMGENDGWLAVISVSGTANVKVWELT